MFGLEKSRAADYFLPDELFYQIFVFKILCSFSFAMAFLSCLMHITCKNSFSLEGCECACVTIVHCNDTT